LVLSILPDELEPGMVLAAPVVNPDEPEQELLRRSFAMTEPVIARIRSMPIPQVFVEFPGLEHLDKHLGPYLSPARAQTLAHIKSSITAVQKGSSPGIPFSLYKQTTQDLVESLLTQGPNPIYMDSISAQGGKAVSHAAAVAHLSLMLGLKLQDYVVNQRHRLPADRAKDIVALGTAGMLHDIGMTRIPESLQHHTDVDRPESEESLRLWQTHVEIGLDLVRKDCDSTTIAVVYQHHQHFDGTGFPTPSTVMENTRIHVFGRIIAVANMFDRLLNPPRGRKRTNAEALDLLKGQYGSWLDPVVLKGLMAIAPPYPPGQRVQLDDGSWVVVVEVDPGIPSKPIVAKLKPDRKTPTNQQIDLRMPGSPQIAVAPDASKLATAPPTPPAADRPAAVIKAA